MAQHKTQYNKVLWQVWGEFYNYPKCCVKAFIGEGSARDRQGVWRGSGFVPCIECANKLDGKDKEYFINWLGRNPFNRVDIGNTIREVKSAEWLCIANKHNYDIDYYINQLNNWKGEIK